MNSIISDEVNRQSNAIAKRREQLRRWNQSETNKESSNIKYSQRVKFCQSYIFLSACSSEDKDEIEYLLKNGIDINTSNIYGLTALHQASIQNNLNMVKYLINQNANINYQDNEGWTPLHAAAYEGNIQIVKYLLNIGAIVDICNNEGQLPIDITEDKDIISILENDIKTKGIDYQQSKNYEHQLMIKHAQDLLYFNKNDFKLTPDSIVHITTGAKALHVAAAKGYLDVIELLIRAGANINSIDNDGWTPLHAAAHWNQHHVIKYFIEKNANLDLINYAGQTPLDVSDGETFLLLKQLKEKQSTIKNKFQQTIIDENSSHNKLNHLNYHYSKTNQDESFINQSSQFQSLTTKYLNSINDNCSNVISSSPSQSLNSKINLSNNNETQLEITPIRWGTSDQTVGDIPNNSGPYVRLRSGNETNPSVPSTVVSVTSCLPSPTTNVTVTTSSNSIEDSKKRINRDEEAEAQRKHRSSQAQRERRSTICVTVDEQQIKNRSNEINELLNNKIGAPSTPLPNNEHHFETDHLQKIIQDKKDIFRTTNQINQVKYIQIPLTDDITTIIANDSLNINDYQQSQRRTNRRNNQRINIGKIIWNNETKEVEILDHNKLNQTLDHQQSTIINSNHQQSTFENNITTQKSFIINNSLSINQINSTIIKLYQQTIIKIEELNQKVEQLEKDILKRDQIIEKLKTSQYIELSMDKREKRNYERKIEQLEQDFKQMDSFKCDNIRLKEENKALIRVISKLSK